jgi:hypothetical protein
MKARVKSKRRHAQPNGAARIIDADGHVRKSARKDFELNTPVSSLLQVRPSLF